MLPHSPVWRIQFKHKTAAAEPDCCPLCSAGILGTPMPRRDGIDTAMTMSADDLRASRGRQSRRGANAMRPGGLDALADQSRRPHVSPGRIAPDLEALICEMRRHHRRWGA